MSTPANATQLLNAMAKGDPDVAPELIAELYTELRRLARNYLSSERRQHTLQPTALVNEVYLRLMGHRAKWKSRAHFFGVAAQLMRLILVDHARSHLSAKRGGGWERIELDRAFLFTEAKSEELLALDESLQRLAKLDQRQSQIVELLFFGGLTVDETARVVGTSPKTVKRDWSVARAWLHGQLQGRHGSHNGTVGTNKGSV